MWEGSCSDYVELLHVSRKLHWLCWIATCEKEVELIMLNCYMWGGSCTDYVELLHVSRKLHWLCWIATCEQEVALIMLNCYMWAGSCTDYAEDIRRHRPKCSGPSDQTPRICPQLPFDIIYTGKCPVPVSRFWLNFARHGSQYTYNHRQIFKLLSEWVMSAFGRHNSYIYIYIYIYTPQITYISVRIHSLHPVISMWQVTMNITVSRMWRLAEIYRRFRIPYWWGHQDHLKTVYISTHIQATVFIWVFIYLFIYLLTAYSKMVSISHIT